MAGRVDEVQFVEAPVVLERHPHGLRLDGDAALALEVHRVEHLLAHLARGKRARQFEHAVGEGGLAVVDVRDDAEVADEGGVHRAQCSKAARGAAPLYATAIAPSSRRDRFETCPYNAIASPGALPCPACGGLAEPVVAVGCVAAGEADGLAVAAPARAAHQQAGRRIDHYAVHAVGDGGGVRHLVPHPLQLRDDSGVAARLELHNGAARPDARRLHRLPGCSSRGRAR